MSQLLNGIAAKKTDITTDLYVTSDWSDGGAPFRSYEMDLEGGSRKPWVPRFHRQRHRMENGSPGGMLPRKAVYLIERHRNRK